jgi:tetratricopeptide (TPR) repeat protein
MRGFLKALIGACALAQGASASAQWYEAVSKHFHIYADESPDDLRRYANKLERFDAAVREARGMPDVDPGNATQVSVFVVRDIAAIGRLFNGDPRSGIAGFYEPRATGSVAFIPRRGEIGKFELGADNVFFHEYTHHLMLQVEDNPLPTWIVEGFAEFFATPVFNDDGSVTIGSPPRYRAEALYTIWGLPLDKMLSGDYNYLTAAEFESIYGRGWLLTHFLSFDLKRHGQITRYIDEIEAGTPPLKSAQDSFGDLKQLDRDLNAYFKKDVFSVATIPASKLHIPAIEVRPLSPAMAELMDDKIKLARAGKRMLAGSIAGHARAVVRKYPDDARATTFLAQAELAAQNWDAASAAADAALRLNPKSDQAMIVKGSALAKLAATNPATANWDAIRSYFANANRIDTENAEPLVEYYRTYVAQGIAPTPNAIQGLEYALALAPQDSKLRLEVVGQFLKTGRLDKARAAIVPLAYSPHAGKAHDAVRRILDEIDAKRSGGALTAWQSAEKLYDDD